MKSFVFLLLVFAAGYAIIWNGVDPKTANEPINATCIYLKHDACAITSGSEIERVDITHVDQQGLSQGDTVVYSVTTAQEKAETAVWFLGIICFVLFIITRIIKWTGIGSGLDIGSSLGSAFD